ncbi:MAG: general stress protein [Chloroflexaceae bacterium]|nr:general stress protein [Chloroflexaceae bacterium]
MTQPAPITLYGVYDDADRADKAMQSLLASGYQQEDVILISDSSGRGPASAGRQGNFDDTEGHMQDRSLERKGSFADTEGHYHDRNQERKGSFADAEPAYHNLNEQPQGSFADQETEADASGDDEVLSQLRHMGLPESDAVIYADRVRNGELLLFLRHREQAIER